MVTGFPRNTLHKAHARVLQARNALDALDNAHTAAEFQGHWAAFLAHAGAVLHNIEGGCNTSPQLRQWYGGVRRMGRKEPFFRYMYQARNAEEHNSALSFGQHVPNGQFYDPAGGTYTVHDSIVIGPNGIFLPPGMEMSHEGHRPITGPARPCLFRIRDEKHGDIYEVPERIGGIVLDATEPWQFASLYLNYLEGFLFDLGLRPPPPSA